MRATLDAQLFCAALEKASKACARRSFVPALEQVKLDFQPGTCRMTATDLELWITAQCPSEGDSFSVVLGNTKDVLKASKSFSGELTVEAEGGQPGKIHFSTATRTLCQGTTPLGDFPEETDHVFEWEYPDVDAAKLFGRFEKIKHAVSADKNRPTITGIQLNHSRVLAIDGYRAAVNTDHKFNVDRPFTAPVGAMKLLTLFKGKPVTLKVGPLFGAFEAEGLSLRFHLIDFDAFNFDAALPTKFEDEYAVDVKEFTDALRYLDKLVKPHQRAIRFDGGNLSTVDGALSAQVAVSGEANIVFGFNVQFMLDALGQFQDVDTVKLQIMSPSSIIVLTAAEENGDGDVALVVPCKLKSAATAA